MARIAKFLTVVAESTKSFPSSFNLCLKNVRQIDGKCLHRINVRDFWKTKVDFIQQPFTTNIYVESKGFEKEGRFQNLKRYIKNKLPSLSPQQKLIFTLIKFGNYK